MMKKLLLGLVVLALTVGVSLADDVYGTLVPPVPASHLVTVNVIIPPRVGIRIDALEHTKVLDLTGVAWYPPAVGAYRAIGTNLISILSTGNYSYAYATNDLGLLTGLTLAEFQYQATGASWVPQAGAGWNSFLANGPLTNPTTRTSGWETRNLDYQVFLDGGESAGTNTLLITYTITALP